MRAARFLRSVGALLLGAASFVGLRTPAGATRAASVSRDVGPAGRAPVAPPVAATNTKSQVRAARIYGAPIFGYHQPRQSWVIRKRSGSPAYAAVRHG